VASAHALQFELYKKRRIAYGSVTRIGTHGTSFKITVDGENYTESVRHTTHRQALLAIIDHLHRNSHINTLRDITLVIHRFMHGGTEFAQSTVLLQQHLQRLYTISHLAPENPASIAVVHASLSQLPSAKQVALFDTAFGALLPLEAQEYPLAPVLRERFGLRRYAYQGILHEGAYARALELVKRKRSVVSVVIDDEVSVVGLRDDIIYETTSGFTKAEGLPGLHSSGSLDPRIPLHLATHLHMSPGHVDAVLSTKSGIAAMAGVTTYAELFAAAKKKKNSAIEALMLLAYRIAQAIAGMSASIGTIDMIVFSGKGSNWMLREEICRRLSHFGVRIGKKQDGIISTPRSKIVVVQVSLTEPEAMILQARRTHLT
jgi:acetate kinase